MRIRLRLEISFGRVNRGVWSENVERTKIERVFLVIVSFDSRGILIQEEFAGFHGRHHRRVKRRTPPRRTRMLGRASRLACERTHTRFVDGTENLEGGREPRTGS